MKILKGDFFYFLIAFVIVLTFSFNPVFNPDLGWHLSSGRYIVENLKIPTKDFMSWSYYGEDWINGEWLSGVLYYLIYIFWGYKGLFALKLLNMFLLSYVLYIAFRNYVKLFNLIWLIPSFLFSMGSILDLRPDNYTFIFFILNVYLLEKNRKLTFSLKNAFVFCVLFILWANIHGGYIYGLISFLIYAFGLLINDNLPYIYGNVKDIKTDGFKKYIFYFLFSLISTLINPYGWKLFLVFIQHLKDMDVYSQYICEWLATDIFSSNFAFYYYLFLTVVLLMYLLRFIKKREFDFVDIFLMVFYGLSSFLHIRLCGFGSFIFHFVLVKSFSHLLNKRFFSLSYVFIIFFYAFYFLFDGYHRFIFAYPYLLNRNFYVNQFISEKAIRFINENFEYFKDKKMYNGWSSGGYLGWVFFGKLKVFVDGRYIFHNLLEKGDLNLFLDRDEFKRIVEKYNFDFILYSVYGKMRFNVVDYEYRGKSYRKLRPVYVDNLDRDKWAIVFFDSVSMIAVKRDVFDRDFIKRHEYKCIAPYDFGRMNFEIYISHKNLECYKKEILRYIKSEKDNPNAFLNEFLNYIREVDRRL